jgi:hypothetical protein
MPTQQTQQQQQKDTPQRDRRSEHRVRNDQKTGEGSMSALSKLRMLERQRAASSPRRGEEESRKHGPK